MEIKYNLNSDGETFIVRWYDRYPNISTIIRLAEHLPPEVQQKIGQNLLDSVKQYQPVLDQMSETKSLGAEAIMRLMKSKRKQRWYDQVPELHNALNMMLQLPEPLLFHLDSRYTAFAQYLFSKKSIIVPDKPAMQKTQEAPPAKPRAKHRPKPMHVVHTPNQDSRLSPKL